MKTFAIAGVPIKAARVILHCSDFTQDGGMARQIEMLCMFAISQGTPTVVLLDDNPAGRTAKRRMVALGCRVLLRPLYRGRIDPESIRSHVGRVVNALRPSVVHFHCGSQRSGIDIRERIVELGIPLIITEYFVSRTVVMDAPLRERVRQNYAQAFASIASCRQQRRLLHNGYQFKCAREIELGYCLAPVKRVRRITESPCTFNLLCVARLVEQKGHEVLLAALRDCSEIGRRELRLWLVGDGPLADNLRQTVADFGLKARVKFFGWRRNLAEIMAHAHCMVLTSHDEGQPLVLLESTAVGLPWIASDVGGVRELAETLGCGLLIPANSPRVLIRRLRSLARCYDDEVRRTRAAKYQLHSRHSPKASFSKIVELWRLAENATNRGR